MPASLWIRAVLVGMVAVAVVLLLVAAALPAAWTVRSHLARAVANSRSSLAFSALATLVATGLALALTWGA
ncbi:MAG: hypothetical protein H0T39_07370 [Actinobacteria bacterium]|nr:hypothetical protein [Actinomycetota bacterium]